MMLRPVGVEEMDLVYGWLTDPENSKWLDFAHGRPLHVLALRVMLRDERYVLRLFGPGEADPPVGLVALSDVNPRHGTAGLWYVLGDRLQRGRGWTTRAVSSLLDHGFGDLGLASVNAWTVEANVASRRILERNGFRLIGRQRACHWLDGRRADRLWFDLLSTEYRGVLEPELSPGRSQADGA